MSKTLSNILTIFKVARVIAKVLFIIAIIGGAGCLLGLCFLPFVDGVLSTFKLGFENDVFADYFACIVGLISCAGEAVFAFMAEKYFKKVLSDGTPFTLESSKESFRLGIASIIISVATSILAGFSIGIMLLFASNAAEYDTNTSFSLTTGLFFLFLSLIFKHGAELQSSKQAEAFEEQTSETETL